MKKLIVSAVLAFIFLVLPGKTGAQTTVAAKSQATVCPTSQNVLMWAKDLSARMEQLSARLNKIKPVKPKEIETKRTIVQARQVLKKIIAKGQNLSNEEGKKHDVWFRNTMSKM